MDPWGLDLWQSVALRAWRYARDANADSMTCGDKPYAPMIWPRSSRGIPLPSLVLLENGLHSLRVKNGCFRGIDTLILFNFSGSDSDVTTCSWLLYVFMTFHILGMSSSQLTFIFFRGVETTNQFLLFPSPKPWFPTGDAQIQRAGFEALSENWSCAWPSRRQMPPIYGTFKSQKSMKTYKVVPHS